MMDLFNQRSVTFDEPIEMLYACHDKVRRFCGQLDNLHSYLVKDGCNEMVLQNIRQISQYFNVAAPLHHLDEEADFFPLLLQYAPHTKSHIDELEAQHQQLHNIWSALSEEFSCLQNNLSYLPDADVLNRFTSAYARHLQLEENLFEIGKQSIPTEELTRIGQLMAARRKT